MPIHIVVLNPRGHLRPNGMTTRTLSPEWHAEIVPSYVRVYLQVVFTQADKETLLAATLLAIASRRTSEGRLMAEIKTPVR